MAFVYHLVPKKLIGNILYPLNELKNKLPEVYKREIEKYKEREYVLEKKIPILNCLWNDVLHFIPVHPSKIKKEMQKAGFKVDKVRWFKIKAEDVPKEKSIIYLYKYNKENPIAESNFIKYNPDKLAKYNKIPTRTKEHYKEAFEKKEKLLRFHFIPHVFLKDSFDTRKAEIIEV
jgi:hypothetical protein